MIPKSKKNGSGSSTASAGEQGYVLLVFVLFAALLMVGLSTMIPKYSFEGRRDKEEELIFRGLQYQRSIQLFVRKMGRYPNSIEQLRKTNGFRFLRKAYKDPMSKEGDWRLIHIGANGALVDAQTSLPLPPNAPGSNLQTGAGGAQPQGLGSSSASGSSGNTNQGGFGGGLSQPSNPGSGLGGGLSGSNPAQPGAIAPGGGTPPDANSPSANPGANPAQQPRTTAQNQGTTDPNAPASGAAPGGIGGSTAPPSGTVSGSTTTSQSATSPVFGGGAIAGVASLSKNESIKVWNTYSEYDKWEFVYDIRRDPVAQSKLGATQQQQPALPGATVTPPGSANPVTPGFPNPGGGGGRTPGFGLPPLPGNLGTPQQR